MIGDLFDNPWKILIVAVVLIVLFGSKKLPDAARSLGKSMRILKTEVGSLHEDEPAADTPAGTQSAPIGEPARLAAGPARSDQQDSIDVLQQQISDLQRAATMNATSARPVPEPQQT
jgi:sec-independent protein translocase protein TatA